MSSNHHTHIIIIILLRLVKMLLSEKLEHCRESNLTKLDALLQWKSEEETSRGAGWKSPTSRTTNHRATTNPWITINSQQSAACHKKELKYQLIFQVQKDLIKRGIPICSGRDSKWSDTAHDTLADLLLAGWLALGVSCKQSWLLSQLTD